jgi:hypothetical protein
MFYLIIDFVAKLQNYLDSYYINRSFFSNLIQEWGVLLFMYTTLIE